MLEIGMKAPGFSLLDKDSNIVSLRDFAGQKSRTLFFIRKIILLVVPSKLRALEMHTNNLNSMMLL